MAPSGGEETPDLSGRLTVIGRGRGGEGEDRQDVMDAAREVAA